MVKISKWRRLCCACGSADDDPGTDRPYERPRRPGPRSNKAANTWTRRSLLDNEQMDESFPVPLSCMAYQMRSIETPTNIPVSIDDDVRSEDRRKLVAKPIPRKHKRTAHDVPDSSSANAADASTTFPWMDESFSAPSVRSGTRLGISSVHINAARRMSAEINNVGNLSVLNQTSSGEKQFFNNTDNLSSFLGNNSHGKDDGQSSAFTRLKTVPYSNTSKDNHVTKASIPRLSSASSEGIYNGGPHVSLKQPTVQHEDSRHISEIGRFPTSCPTQTGELDLPSGLKVRPSVMDIFPIDDSRQRAGEDPEDANVSYASEITFRKAPGFFSGQNMQKEQESVQRRKKPAQDLLKSKSTKGKGNTKPDVKNRAVSMYGYVPKAVTDVRASYALEGSTIDDFFKMRASLHERTCLTSLPYTEGGKSVTLSSESETDDEEPHALRAADEKPYVITTVVETDEDQRSELTENAIDTATKSMSKSENDTKKTQNVIAINNMIERLDLDLRSSQTHTNGTSFSSEHVQKDKFTDHISRPKHVNVEQNGFVNRNSNNENENKVIMIDFPPNLESVKWPNSESRKFCV